MKKAQKTDVAPKKKRGSFWGVLLIVLGAILLLNTFGFFKEAVFSVFGMFWPVGLIIAGVFFIFRMKGTGHLFLALTIVLGIMYLFSGSHGSFDEETYEQKIPVESSIEIVELSLEYGAGEITLAPGSDFFMNEIVTSDGKEPELDVTRLENTMSIDVSRHMRPGFWHHGSDTWDVTISPDVIYDLDIDFGAAELDVDLRGLLVRSLDIDTGASDSYIIFGSYPTSVDIDTGASSVEFEFPSNMHVILDYDGGASSVDLNGFYKEDGIWYSEGFDANSLDIISVTINAGASSIDGSFYEVASKIVEEEVETQEAVSDVVIQMEIINSTKENTTNASVEE